MTKKIVAVNCSPRAKWNTAQLVQAACVGAAEAGAEVQYFDLYERLCFQYLTYRSDVASCNPRSIPVLFMMTSNASEQWYGAIGYDAMIAEHTQTLERFIGPVTTFMCTDTLQTDHYERYDWTIFDVTAKQARHETVFPQDLAKVRELRKALVQ